MSISISSEADELLRDEPAELYKLYAYFCRHRNFNTAVVGLERRISYQSMRELIEVPSVAGRQASPCSKANIQSLLRRMVRIGLVVDMKRCVFLLPFEKPPNSVSERLLRGDYEVGTSKYIDLQGKTGGGLLRGCSEVATPLFNQSINQSAVDHDQFRMSDAWVPSAEFSARARSFGFLVDEGLQDCGLMALALADLRMYWQGERPDEVRNQVGWERALLGTMKQFKANPPVVARSRAGKAKAQSGVAKLPFDDSKLQEWARRYGAAMAKPGVSYFDYRRELKVFRDQLVRDGVVN